MVQLKGEGERGRGAWLERYLCVGERGGNLLPRLYDA